METGLSCQGSQTTLLDAWAGYGYGYRYAVPGSRPGSGVGMDLKEPWGTKNSERHLPLKKQGHTLVWVTKRRICVLQVWLLHWKKKNQKYKIKKAGLPSKTLTLSLPKHSHELKHIKIDIIITISFSYWTEKQSINKEKYRDFGAIFIVANDDENATELEDFPWGINYVVFYVSFFEMLLGNLLMYYKLCTSFKTRVVIETLMIKFYCFFLIIVYDCSMLNSNSESWCQIFNS